MTTSRRGGWEVFYQDRQVPQPGSLMTQPGLANTLKVMRDASVAAGSGKAGLQAARDSFYRGPIADSIVKSVEKVGGILSMDDLADYRSQFADPVGASFHGHDIRGQNTWTQGPMLMQTLNILENFDLKSMGHNSPAYIHTVAEALKLSFGDREAFYGDPDFVEVPLDGLLSKEYAAERSQLIDPGRRLSRSTGTRRSVAVLPPQREDGRSRNVRSHPGSRCLGGRWHYPRLGAGP